MTEPAPTPGPTPPTDPSVWRRRMWLAVAAVAGLWAFIYITVVVAFVVSSPEDPHRH